jgi:hypothetical protein
MKTVITILIILGIAAIGYGCLCAASLDDKRNKRD